MVGTDEWGKSPRAGSPEAESLEARSPRAGVAPGLLDGVVVLDLASVGPAARCSRLLADYGATVVKVGAVPGADAQPIRPPAYAYSGSRSWLHISIDLKDPDGLQAFGALVRTADVVVESFRPGVVDRLGVGFAALQAINPAIILCSTTGYGQHGPRSGWSGHDINYLAAGGFLAAGEPAADGGPPVPGATIADAAGGGMHAALAVMAALIGRQRTGAGRHLDVSIADGVLWLTSLGLDEFLATGTDVGFGHDVISGRYACYDTYRAADGKWLAVGAIEPKFFANLCRLLGCEQWIEHQFDDAVQEEIRDAFGLAFAARSRDEWVDELSGADTCVSPVQAAAEVACDEQFAARGSIIEVVDKDSHRYRQVGYVLAGMEQPDGPVCLGDPNASDAAELLRGAGVPAERIEKLLGAGVVA